MAVSFVWAPANPAHEQRALRMVAEAMPDVFVCAGHEVYPQVREYTRTSTTIVNAYLSPVMARYVARIDDYFRGLGARGAVRYFQSNGGLAVGEIMRRRAVNAINSGPASAPQAGLYVAAPFGIDNIITVDMGGTSFDITLARGGQTNLNRNIDFLRHRIGVPMIHVETLGAGGGSIAHLNAFGMLEVGPRSAGAMPAGLLRPGRRGTDRHRRQHGAGLPAPGRGAGRRHPPGPRARRRRHPARRGRAAGPEPGTRGARHRHAGEPEHGQRHPPHLHRERLRSARLRAGLRRGAAGMHIAALAEEIGSRNVLVPKIASCLCAFGQVISDVNTTSWPAP